MGPRNEASPPVLLSKVAIAAADAQMNVTIIVHGDGTQRSTILVFQG